MIHMNHGHGTRTNLRRMASQQGTVAPIVQAGATVALLVSGNTKMGTKPTYKTDPLNIELYRLKELLRGAVQDMSVARFVELRRQFDMVWSEVLEEL